MSTTLPVRGQGVFVFNAAAAASTQEDISSCAIRFLSAVGANGLLVEFVVGHVLVRELGSLRPLEDPKNNQGLSSHKGAYYWFSLDAQNQRLHAGIGEARLETAIYTYTFPASEKPFLESLSSVAYSEQVVQPIRLLKDPVRRHIPLVVKDTDDITMDDIATDAVMPKANLPLVGQKLFNCIAGKQFQLNTPDFPEFSQAIEYSIRTPGLWCYKKLREKSREFNPDVPDLSETYLRITLGENNGESPGIPYVMEIWPVGHYSPVHSHSDANAIIRVLNGEIQVSLFPFLCSNKTPLLTRNRGQGGGLRPPAEKGGIDPFAVATFKEGDIAWITPTLNQTHQLKNRETSSNTCITIQCYMYAEKDKGHYDYFDYLDVNGAKQLYQPDSDMDFVEFKKRMREEWEARRAAAPAAGKAKRRFSRLLRW